MCGYFKVKGKLKNICSLEQVKGMHSLPSTAQLFSLTKGNEGLFWLRLLSLTQGSIQQSH